MSAGAIASLVALIAAASGPTDFPARIGMNASTLAELATHRFDAGGTGAQLAELCGRLVNRTVEDAYFEHPDFSADDARVLAFCLNEHPGLLGLSCVAPPAIREAARHRAPAAHSLSNVNTGAEGAEALSEAIRTTSALRTLLCVLGAPPAAACSPLSARPSYTNASIGDQGVRALAGAITTHPALEHLECVRCSARSAGGAAHSARAASRGTPSPRSARAPLRICCSQTWCCGRSSACAVRSAQRCHRLSTTRLRHSMQANAVGSGLLEIVAALVNNPALEYLLCVCRGGSADSRVLSLRARVALRPTARTRSTCPWRT